MEKGEKICLICRLGYSFCYEDLKYQLRGGEIETNYAALPTYLYLKEKEGPPDLVILAVDFPSREGFEIDPSLEGDIRGFLEEYGNKMKRLREGKEIPAGVLDFADMLREEGVEAKILRMYSPREETGEEDKYEEWKRIVNELKEKLGLNGEEKVAWKIYLDLTHGFRPLSDLLWEAVRYLQVSYYDRMPKVQIVYEFWPLVSKKCYPKELVGFERCREIVESARYMIRYGVMSKELLKGLNLEEEPEKVVASFYKDLRECDVVGALKRVKELRKALKGFPEDPPAPEVKRMIELEFSGMLSLQDPDPTVLRPEALLGFSFLIDWYLSKGNVLSASITSFEALRYALTLLLSEKKGEFGRDLKGRGALQRRLKKAGILLNSVGRGTLNEIIENVEGSELKEAFTLSSEGEFKLEEIVTKCCLSRSLEDLAYEPLSKFLKGRELEEVMEDLKILEEFKEKVMTISAVGVIISKIRDFLAHAGIAWTPRPREEGGPEQVLLEIMRENKREIIGLSSSYIKKVAEQIF